MFIIGMYLLQFFRRKLKERKKKDQQEEKTKTVEHKEGS